MIPWLEYCFISYLYSIWFHNPSQLLDLLAMTSQSLNIQDNYDSDLSRSLIYSIMLLVTGMMMCLDMDGTTQVASIRD